jgi:hypothetical protein
LTATSFGNATGTVGVLVEVAGAVLDGSGVWVGISVEAGCVIDGVITDSVGVSVAAFAGRLHASIARTRASTNKKLRDFIAVLLYFSSILLNEYAACNRPFGLFLNKEAERFAFHFFVFLISSPGRVSWPCC